MYNPFFKGLLYIAPLLIIEMLLISLFSAGAVVDFICSCVDVCAMSFIWIAVMTGLVCFWLSISGVLRAQRNLNNLLLTLNDLKDAATRRKKCAEMMAVLETEPDFGLRIGWLDDCPRHLYTRLRALGFKNDAHCENDMKRQKLPLLSDLHELTLQSEMSRTCVSGMYTIVSVLLILGILGTLSRVHGFIDAHVVGENLADILDLKKLTNALEPGMWAVFFTVLLLLLRGVYLCSVERYLARLDCLTIDGILPYLETNKKTEDELSKIGAAVKGEEMLSLESLSALKQNEIITFDLSAIIREYDNETAQIQTMSEIDDIIADNRCVAVALSDDYTENIARKIRTLHSCMSSGRGVMNKYNNKRKLIVNRA